MELGKRPATAPRVRTLHEMLGCTDPKASALPPVPAAIDWGAAVADWGMLDNDTIGDCTIAAVGHAVLNWTSAAGDPWRMTDADALAGYEAFGYRPDDPTTDRGANAQDVLAHWTQGGFACGGADDRLTGFCFIDPQHVATAKAGIAWLGAIYVGIALPIAMQGATRWSVPVQDIDNLGSDWAPGSWGGHAVVAVGYDANAVTVITWGKPLRMSWQFWRAYVDEAYGLLDRDFAAASIPAETWPRLEADMAALRAEAAA